MGRGSIILAGAALGGILAALASSKGKPTKPDPKGADGEQQQAAVIRTPQE